MLDTKIELTQVDVSGGEDPAAAHTAHDDDSWLEKQTRTRRLFSTAQIFCFSLVYFGTWSGMGAYVGHLTTGKDLCQNSMRLRANILALVLPTETCTMPL